MKTPKNRNIVFSIYYFNPGKKPKDEVQEGVKERFEDLFEGVWHTSRERLTRRNKYGLGRPIVLSVNSADEDNQQSFQVISRILRENIETFNGDATFRGFTFKIDAEENKGANLGVLKNFDRVWFDENGFFLTDTDEHLQPILNDKILEMFVENGLLLPEDLPAAV